MLRVGERVDKPAQDRLRVADERHRGLMHARRLLGIGIDADDRDVVVDAPLRERVIHPRADAEHDVGLAPELAAERQRHAEGIAAVEHAAAAPIAEHRRLQHVRRGP